MTSPRRGARTLITMTVLAGIASLAMAACVGYYFGRRADARPSTWKKRTSRIALASLAINLLVLVTARRIRRRGLLRGSVARYVATAGQGRAGHRRLVGARR